MKGTEADLAEDNHQIIMVHGVPMSVCDVMEKIKKKGKDKKERDFAEG